MPDDKSSIRKKMPADASPTASPYPVATHVDGAGGSPFDGYGDGRKGAKTLKKRGGGKKKMGY